MARTRQKKTTKRINFREWLSKQQRASELKDFAKFAESARVGWVGYTTTSLREALEKLPPSPRQEEIFASWSEAKDRYYDDVYS